MAESVVLCPGRRRHAAGAGSGRHSGDPAALWVGARRNRSGSIAYDRISHVLRNPLADVTLLAIAIVAVIAIFAELVTLFVLASHHQETGVPGAEATSLRLVLRQVWGTIKKLVHPQGLLMIVYLILLLPLGQLGLTSVLTKKVAVPPFISEELSKNPSQSLLYSGVLLVITYLNLRLIFTLPLLGTTSAGVWEAFVTSWRLTRWRSLRILGLFVLITLLRDSSLSSSARLLWHQRSPLTSWPCLITMAGRPGTQCLSDRRLRDRSAADDHDRPVADCDDARLAGTPACRSSRRPDRHFVLRTVTCHRRGQRLLWGLAAGVIVMAFTITAVLNHRTMVNLVDSEQTEVLAHRGFIQGGVENTLPALQAAAQAGADRVEFDVMETKDGKFVVMHDANLKRLAGKNLNVKDLTQEELTKITVRAGGMEAKIPTLEEWIQLDSAQSAAVTGDQAAWRRES